MSSLVFSISLAFIDFLLRVVAPTIRKTPLSYCCGPYSCRPLFVAVPTREMSSQVSIVGVFFRQGGRTIVAGYGICSDIYLSSTCFATYSVPSDQLLLDLSAMMEVPSLRVFCLESTQTLDEDPEGMFQVSDVANRKYILPSTSQLAAVATALLFLPYPSRISVWSMLHGVSPSLHMVWVHRLI